MFYEGNSQFGERLHRYGWWRDTVENTCGGKRASWSLLGNWFLNIVQPWVPRTLPWVICDPFLLLVSVFNVVPSIFSLMFIMIRTGLSFSLLSVTLFFLYTVLVCFPRKILILYGFHVGTQVYKIVLQWFFKISSPWVVNFATLF